MLASCSVLGCNSIVFNLLLDTMRFSALTIPKTVLSEICLNWVLGNFYQYSRSVDSYVAVTIFIEAVSLDFCIWWKWSMSLEVQVYTWNFFVGRCKLFGHFICFILYYNVGYCEINNSHQILHFKFLHCGQCLTARVVDNPLFLRQKIWVVVVQTHF